MTTSNTLDAIVPKILARGMLSFRERAIMPRLVTNDFSAEAARHGDRVDIPIAGSVIVGDVEPSHVAPAPSASNIETHSLTLDNWKKVSFFLTDKEMMQVDADQNFIPYQMQEAVAALAESMNKSFFDDIDSVAHVRGRKNNTLFSANDDDAGKLNYKTAHAIAARRILNEETAPKEGRFAILNYEQEAQALALSEFADASQSGDREVRIQGEIGRKYGIDWFSSDHLPTQTSEANTDLRLSLQNRATKLPKGSTSLTVTGSSNDYKKGDMIVGNTDDTIIGVVGEDVQNIPNQAVTLPLIAPTTREVATSERFHVITKHEDSLVFQRNAFAFATRPLASMAEQHGFGNRIMSVTDPASGLSLRLEISRQYKQTVWEFDALWGVKLIKPQFAIRLVTAS